MRPVIYSQGSNKTETIIWHTRPVKCLQFFSEGFSVYVEIISVQRKDTSTAFFSSGYFFIALDTYICLSFGGGGIFFCNTRYHCVYDLINSVIEFFWTLIGILRHNRLSIITSIEGMQVRHGEKVCNRKFGSLYFTQFFFLYCFFHHFKVF